MKRIQSPSKKAFRSWRISQVRIGVVGVFDLSVFTTDAFKKWAKENVILLEVDFPRRFKLPAAIANQNAGLQQAFQVRGYPTIFVFNMFPDKNTGKVNLQSLARTAIKQLPLSLLATWKDRLKLVKRRIQINY